MQSRRFSVAPMMDWSDRHCRYFWRRLTKHSLLYTEMVTTGALLHANADHFLAFHPEEQDLALQLGGSEPADLARCAEMAQEYGYREVNLNCGCPSPRVQRGAFGACLMAEADLVARCVSAMRDACDLPVTVKHRIGIDEQDSPEFLLDFVNTVADAGCDVFIVHARKAWLKGLSPKQNREIPPLMPERVRWLKQKRPDLQFIINGGICDWNSAEDYLSEFDGIMLGRAAYQDPWLLQQVDQRVFDQATPLETRLEAVMAMRDYIEEALGNGVRLHHITRHMLGLFNQQPGAKAWRRHLSLHANRDGADFSVLEDAARWPIEAAAAKNAA